MRIFENSLGHAVYSDDSQHAFEFGITLPSGAGRCPVRNQAKSFYGLEVSAIERHQRQIVAEATGRNPSVIRRDRIALDLAACAYPAPGAAHISRVREYHNVPKPSLEPLDPSRAPAGFERPLEELPDRGER